MNSFALYCLHLNSHAQPYFLSFSAENLPLAIKLNLSYVLQEQLITIDLSRAATLLSFILA